MFMREIEVGSKRVVMAVGSGEVVARGRLNEHGVIDADEINPCPGSPVETSPGVLSWSPNRRACICPTTEDKLPSTSTLQMNEWPAEHPSEVVDVDESPEDIMPPQVESDTPNATIEETAVGEGHGTSACCEGRADPASRQKGGACDCGPRKGTCNSVHRGETPPRMRRPPQMS